MICLSSESFCLVNVIVQNLQALFLSKHPQKTSLVGGFKPVEKY